jgi:hypothetical protein
MKITLFLIAALSVVASACSSSQVKPMTEEERAEWRRERMMFHHGGRLGV